MWFIYELVGRFFIFFKYQVGGIVIFLAYFLVIVCCDDVVGYQVVCFWVFFWYYKQGNIFCFCWCVFDVGQYEVYEVVVVFMIFFGDENFLFFDLVSVIFLRVGGSGDI